MAAIKFDLKSILTKHCLPGGDDPAGRGKAAPFTAYFCRDDKSLWISDAEGNLVSLSDVLSGVGGPRAFPAQGCAGKDGATGPQGEQGRPGRDAKDGAPGINGRDSFVPGPPGASVQGPQGERGPAGPDSAEVLSEVRHEIAALREELAQVRALYQRLLEAEAEAKTVRAKAFARLHAQKT